MDPRVVLPLSQGSGPLVTMGVHGIESKRAWATWLPVKNCSHRAATFLASALPSLVLSYLFATVRVVHGRHNNQSLHYKQKLDETKGKGHMFYIELPMPQRTLHGQHLLAHASH